MVSELISIAALCITAAVICKLFERYGKEYSLFISAAVCALVVGVISLYIAPILEIVNGIFLRTGLGGEYLSVLFKALGVSYLTQFACDICRDSGESTLSAQIELAGKIAMLTLALPLFEDIAAVVAELVFN